MSSSKAYNSVAKNVRELEKLEEEIQEDRKMLQGLLDLHKKK